MRLVVMTQIARGLTSAGQSGAEPAPEDLYRMLGYNLAVPPYVRQALFSRVLDNDDLLRTIRTLVLVVHGAEDAIVKPCVVEHHMAKLAHAQVHLLQGAGMRRSGTPRRHSTSSCAPIVKACDRDGQVVHRFSALVQKSHHLADKALSARAGSSTRSRTRIDASQPTAPRAGDVTYDH